MSSAFRITLATVANPVVAGSALVVYGMSTSTGMVAYQSTLQSAVTPDTRGRAFAFFDIVWNTARLISLVIGGVLADQLDVMRSGRYRAHLYEDLLSELRLRSFPGTGRLSMLRV